MVHLHGNSLDITSDFGTIINLPGLERILQDSLHFNNPHFWIPSPLYWAVWPTRCWRLLCVVWLIPPPFIHLPWVEYGHQSFPCTAPGLSPFMVSFEHQKVKNSALFLPHPFQDKVIEMGHSITWEVHIYLLLLLC